MICYCKSKYIFLFYYGTKLSNPTWPLTNNNHLSSEENPGYLLYIGNDILPSEYGDCNKPL